MDLVCVYVVKEHLGFHTDPTIIEMQNGEDLNDTMWRVLTEKWSWSHDQVKTMIATGKIKYFKIHPLFTEVWCALTNFINRSSFRYGITVREHSELCIKICEALKIEDED